MTSLGARAEEVRREGGRVADAGEPDPLLSFLEIGLHISRSPAAVPGGLPAVVVRRVAAGPQLRVNGRRAAQGPAPRDGNDAPIQPGLRDCRESPVECAAEHPGEQDRHLDLGITPRIRAAGLQDDHFGLLVGAEALREHATRGASPNDHVIGGRHAVRFERLTHDSSDSFLARGGSPGSR